MKNQKWYDIECASFKARVLGKSESRAIKAAFMRRTLPEYLTVVFLIREAKSPHKIRKATAKYAWTKHYLDPLGIVTVPGRRKDSIRVVNSPAVEQVAR